VVLLHKKIFLHSFNIYFRYWIWYGCADLTNGFQRGKQSYNVLP